MSFKNVIEIVSFTISSMSKHLKILFFLFILTGLLSCSKEKRVERANEKLNGKWKVVSWELNSSEVLGVPIKTLNDSLITQCGNKVPYFAYETRIADTFEFDDSKILYNGSRILNFQTNYFRSYSECSLIDTTYETYYSTKLSQSNFVKPTKWKIDENDESHLTLTFTYAILHQSYTEWYSYTLDFEIIELRKNELIIKANNNCLFDGTNKNEEIKFIRVE